MPFSYTERRKVPGISLEVRGSFLDYDWILWSHGKVLTKGRAWTRRRAWTKVEAAAERDGRYMREKADPSKLMRYFFYSFFAIMVVGLAVFAQVH